MAEEVTIPLRNVVDSNPVTVDVVDIYQFYSDSYSGDLGVYKKHVNNTILKIRLSQIPAQGSFVFTVNGQPKDSKNFVDIQSGMYLLLNNIELNFVGTSEAPSPGAFSISTDTFTKGYVYVNIGTINSSENVLKIYYKGIGSLVFASDINELASGQLLKDEIITKRLFKNPIDLTGKTLNIDNISISNMGEVATKSYVQSYIAGIDVKQTVSAATTGMLNDVHLNDYIYSYNGTNVTISSIVSNSNTALVIDGVTLQNNDRILIKDGVNISGLTNKLNGIYKVINSGSSTESFVLIRADDFSPWAAGSISNGAFVSVNDGSTNGKTFWINTSKDPLGISGIASPTDSDIIFEQYYNADARWAVNGNNIYNLNLSGNVGIGTTNPTAKLEVNGQVKITGGVPGAGKLLSSDANGLASWIDLSTITFSGELNNGGDVHIGEDLYVKNNIYIGDPVTNPQVYFYANINATNKPFIFYSILDQKWGFSNDGDVNNFDYIQGVNNTVNTTAAENINAGQAVYVNSSGLVIASNSSSATAPCIGIALATVAAGTNVDVLIRGFYDNPSYSFSNIGKIVYLGASGGLTQTAPTASGSQVQIVGIATGATSLFLNVSYNIVEIA